MHKLHELKDKLCYELGKYSDKDTFSVSDIDTIHGLASSVKDLSEYIEMHEDEGSYGMGGRYAYDDRAYSRRNAKRDSMGRYSRDEDMISELRSYMQSAPEHKKAEIRRMMEM